MIEGEFEKPVEIAPMAGLFLHRLMDLMDLRTKIDHDQLPFAYFNEIPILPQNTRKGNLRWGVLKGIEDAYITLVDEGYEMEARAVLAFQERQNGRT